MFRGSERIRLVTMLGTLCILGMIIFRSLGSNSSKPAVGNDEPAQTDSAQTAVAPTPEKEEVEPGPTDEDPDELAEAENQFGALTDVTEGIGKLEMPAYRTVFAWVEHQTFDDMMKRARRDVSFDEMVRTPEKCRGKLVEINLNLKLVKQLDDKLLTDGPLYELWGTTDRTGLWLYCVIAPQLPKGIPIGVDIDERLKVVGYFFKLQGYLPRGAKPNDSLWKAPLLIGRVKWISTGGRGSAPTDYRWLYYAAAGFVLLGFFFSLAQFISRRSERRHQTQLDELKGQRSHASFDQDDSTANEKFSTPEESDSDRNAGFDFREMP